MALLGEGHHHIRSTPGRRYLAVGIDLCSMSAKGCRWDNAVVESIFSTLKLEPNLDDNREVLISPQELQWEPAF